MKFSQIFSLFFVFVSYHCFLLPALVEGMLVKTPQGLVPVEQLKVGNMVLSYGSHNTLKEVQILSITKDTTNVRLIINTEQGILIACEDQFFYTDIHKWVRASDITDDYALFDCNFNLCQCGKTIRVCDTTTIYRITIEFPHTLFISELQIVTHI